MSDVATYSAVHSLQDGRAIRIRALKPEDRSGLLEAVRRSSPQSLYRRFFGLKRHFSEEEVAYFVNVDFVNHVALTAEIEDARSVHNRGWRALCGPGARPSGDRICGNRSLPRPGAWHGIDAQSRQHWAPSRTYSVHGRTVGQ